MRILFLTKRRYMSKDVIGDRYGRFFELPEQLALQGHRVACMAASYHTEPAGSAQEMVTDAGVVWRSQRFAPHAPLSVAQYLGQLRITIQQLDPEVIVGCSDAFHVIAAVQAGRLIQRPVAVDIYDQFEAYGASKLPGVRPALRRAVRQAQAVFCVSSRLVEWAQHLRPGGLPPVLLPNAVRGDLFYPRDRAQSRARFRLPQDAQIVGTAGSLTKDRDIDTLYRAFLTASEARPDLHLAVAGPRDRPPPQHARIHDLGVLDHEEIPWLFSSLNVGVVSNQHSLFSSHCHPQKLVELRACGTAAVVADTLSPGEIDNDPDVWTYEAGNAGHLAEVLVTTLSRRTKVASTVPTSTWATSALRLGETLNMLWNSSHTNNPFGTSQST